MRYNLLDETIVVDVFDGSGTIESDLHFDEDEVDEHPELIEWEAAIDAFEGMILACACAGINVSSEEFQNAVRTALQGIENHFG